jgi:hypothetical protein
MDKTGTCENLVRDIQSLDGISGKCPQRRQLRYRARCRVTIQLDIAGELPVARPDIAGARDRAVLDIERVGSHPEAIRRHLKKDLPDFGAGVA